MALTEIIALLRSKDKIVYPVTQLQNVTDDAGALTAPADADSVPIADASDSGQMKKITWANIKTALSNLFAAKSHTHHTNEVTHSNLLNIAGGTYYIDRGFIDRAGANRLAFLPATAIKIEYSEDAGKTWKDYGATDAEKRKVFDMTSTGSIKVCKNVSTSRAVTTNDRMRITVSPTDRYAQVDQAYIWLTTPGHRLKCDIERSTIGEKETFTMLRQDITVAGWSGPNTITFSPGTFGGGASQTSNFYSYRFTFKITSVGSSYTTSSPIIYDLRMYGVSVYSIPNQMMKNGHLYSWDYKQNATFPGSVTADRFIGAEATQTEAGLQSPEDKEKLDGISPNAASVFVQSAEPTQKNCIWIKTS